LSMPRPQPIYTLFPYTTLFRSRRQVCDLEALPLEPLGGIQRRLVLGADRDDVIALFLVELGGPLERQIDALGGTGREDDLFLVRSEEHTSELQSLAYLVCRLLL